MDDDGPEDGDDILDDDAPVKPSRGNLIVLPGGKTVDPHSDLGADYVAGPVRTGNVQPSSPEVIDPVAVDAEIRERERFVSEQKMTEVVRRHGTAHELGEAVLAEIVEELSHLKFERRKAIKDGKNSANYSVSRIAGLRSLADLLLKRLEAARGEHLDLKSPRLQAIFKVWMEFFYDSMEKSGVEPQIIDLVFQQMKADMIGWERKMDGAEAD
jgi:hypothetical protein